MDEVNDSSWEERYREAEERCRVSSTQVERFQQQAGRVRSLLTSKLQEMEGQINVSKARAKQAEEQARELEDKLQSVEKELTNARDQIELLERCGQDRDQTVTDLEQRLHEESKQHSQVVSENETKMTKIKEWVASKLDGLQREIMLYQARETEAARLIALLKMAESGNKDAAYGQLIDNLQSLFSTLDTGVNSVSLKMRGRSYSVGSSPHNPYSPPILRKPDAIICDELPIEVKAPPPLPLKQPKSSVGCHQEAETIPVRSPRQAYVQLDLSDPSRIIVSDLTAVGSSSSMSPISLSNSIAPIKINRGDYIAIDPNNPMQLPDVVEECDEDNETEIGEDTGRPPLLSSDTFYSAFSVEDDAFYDPETAVSPLEIEGTESIYEIPIEQLLRQKQLEQHAEQQKQLGAGHNVFSLPRQTAKQVGKYQTDQCVQHRQSRSPPPLPKHRHPSWESRIYDVASTSIQTSPAPLSQRALEPVKFTTLSRKGSIYNNKDKCAPVFATLKGHAAQLRGTPFTGESSDSSDHETDQLLFSPPAVYDHRISSGDYEVPPDAHEFPNAATALPPTQPIKIQLSEELRRDRSLTRDDLEKSGYLTKLGSKVKNWKRYWFVLSANKLSYYRTQSEVGRKKPRGVIELDSFCCLSLSEGAHTFQIGTDKRAYYLTAESASTLEQWLKVLQNVLRKSVTRPRAVDKSADKVLVKGWLTKVKRGRVRKCWCLLTGTVLSYYRKPSDKSPLGQIDLKGCTVVDVDEIEDSGSETEDTGSVSSRQQSSDYAIQVDSTVHGNIYFIIPTKQEKDTWLYHFGVASGLPITQTGTDTEKLIGSLMRVDGSPESRFWSHTMLCHSKDAITKPLTTLPSTGLETDAIQMFKSVLLFTTISVNFSAIEYHINLAQTVIGECVTKQELQSELYCQLIRQTNRHPEPDSSQAIQCWMLLALSCPIFLPQQKYLWYFKHYLQRHASMRPIAVRYAVYCQRCVERAESNGARESRPSRMEVLSVLLGDAVKHASPLSIPVHLPSQRYQVVSFDGSTLVKELNGRLSQELGMRDPLVTGFALLTDDPLTSDVEHCLEPDVKVCDAISLWEITFREGNQGKVDPSRAIKIMFKNRLYFKNMVRGETERERLLILYQALETIINGHFPINKDLAIELGSLMMQIEFGDHRPVGGSITIAQEVYQRVEHALAKFLPSKMVKDMTFEERRQVSSQLTEKWAALRGRQPADCARIYLNVCRRWPLFGARLFPCRRKSSDYSQVWLAVQEDSISTLDLSTLRLLRRYSYESIVTFGGHKDDFMVVVKQSTALTFSPHQLQLGTEKLLFGMRPGLVTEVTNLIASYINAIKFRQSIGYPEATTRTPPTPGEQTLPVHATTSLKHGTGRQSQSPDELRRSKSQPVVEPLNQRRWQRKVEVNVPFPAAQTNGQPRVTIDQHGELCETSSA